MIRKRGDKFVVTDKAGTKVLGTHSSEGKAKKQLAAIEISKAKHMKENKTFKAFRSTLTESEYSEVLTGYGNRSAHKDDAGLHHLQSAGALAGINAMLATIGKGTYLDPNEAFLKMKVRLNVVQLDFDWKPRSWDGGVGSYDIPVVQFGRVDGYDALTGQIRFDGKANPTGGYTQLNLHVDVELTPESLYVVTAKLTPAAPVAEGVEVAEAKKGSGLMTDIHNPKGKAVVNKSGKVLKYYSKERSAIKHATSGKAVKEEMDVNEDIQTPERSAEMRQKYKDEWLKGDTAARKVKAKDAAEKAHPTKLYGKGGKVVAARKAKPTQYTDSRGTAKPTDYTHWKKGGVVVEDIQTPAREREMKRKIEKHEAKAQSGYEARMTKTGKAAARGSKQEERHDKAAVRLLKRDTKEFESPYLYGRGGKIVKRKGKPVREETELDEGVFAQVGKKLQRAGQTVSAKVKKAYALADGQRLGDSTLTPRDRLKEIKWERANRRRAAKRKELAKQKQMGKPVREEVEQIDEVSPPGMEKMTGSKHAKASFAKQYGKRGKSVMYATAWKQYNKKKAMSEEIEEIAEGAKETQKRASELSDKLRKKDPKKSKMYRNISIKALQRSINPTGVSTSNRSGSGNKAQRRLGKEPVPSPMSSDKIRGYFKEFVEETEQLDETMTRKHFQQVADLIKSHPDAKKREELAQHHSEIFKKSNPRFDETRFRKACGVGGCQNESVEQIDEISLDAATRAYAEREKRQKKVNWEKGEGSPEASENSSKAFKTYKYIKKRYGQSGVNKAHAAAVKEAAEQIDEAGAAKLARMGYAYDRARIGSRGVNNPERKQQMRDAYYKQREKVEASKAKRVAAGTFDKGRELEAHHKRMDVIAAKRAAGKAGKDQVRVAEAAEQIDELSKKTRDAYVAKRGSQLSSMLYGPSKNYASLTGRQQANAVKGIKRATGVSEELVGGQKKLDVNKNNRLDSHDFALLRAKKKQMQGAKPKKTILTQKVQNGKKIGSPRPIAKYEG